MFWEPVGPVSGRPVTSERHRGADGPVFLFAPPGNVPGQRRTAGAPS